MGAATQKGKMVQALITGEFYPDSGATPQGRCWEMSYPSASAAEAGIPGLEPLISQGATTFDATVSFNNFGNPIYSGANCDSLPAFAGAQPEITLNLDGEDVTAYAQTVY